MLKFKTLILLLFPILNFASCIFQNKPVLEKEDKVTSTSEVVPNNTNTPVGEYLVEIFEDSKGNLWFGTIAKGVARYDGESLTYFSIKDGLIGNAVVSIVEDKDGTLWLATHAGLSKFDGHTFTNFTEKDGLINNATSKVFIDSKENVWIGTWKGVSRFNGTAFTDFPLPIPDVETPNYQETQEWVTEIIEDSKGNIWFGRSGYGACKWDGDTFIQFTKKDGLPSNCVQDIEEDNEGNIWFTTRIAEKDHPDSDKRVGAGGLCRFDGRVFSDFSKKEGLSKNDIYNIYKDKRGDLWIGANGVGVYRYDGEEFTLFNETDRSDLNKNFLGIQSILEDKDGQLWIGTSGGLFKLVGLSINHVSQEDFEN